MVEDAIVAGFAGFNQGVQFFSAADTVLEKPVERGGFVASRAGDDIVQAHFFGRRLFHGNGLSVRDRDVIGFVGWKLFSDLAGLNAQVFFGDGNGDYQVWGDAHKVDEILRVPVSLLDDGGVVCFAQGQKVLDLLPVFQAAGLVFAFKFVQCAEVDAGHDASTSLRN